MPAAFSVWLSISHAQVPDTQVPDTRAQPPLIEAATARAESEALPDSATSLSDGIRHWTTLYKTLRQVGVPFPEYFTRVAIVESGWQFNHGVGQLNNFFGMRSRPGYPGTSHGYAIYPSQLASIQDLKLWCDYAPPRPDEAPVAFLRRRRWNPFPGYYAYIATVRPFAWARQRLRKRLEQAAGQEPLHAMVGSKPNRQPRSKSLIPAGEARAIYASLAAAKLNPTKIHRSASSLALKAPALPAQPMEPSAELAAGGVFLPAKSRRLIRRRKQLAPNARWRKV